MEAARTVMRATTALTTFGLVVALGIPAFASGAPVSAQNADCNPAYIPTASYCIPNSPTDLNCDNIGDRQIQLVDPNNDPYGLDDVGVGDGITCNGGDPGSSDGSSSTRA